MAERSFKEQVKTLRLGAGETFHGENILAVTKALLESGVSYIGGYQGAPVSHLIDVFADAQDLLDELNINFESSASEATAAAMLLMRPVAELAATRCSSLSSTHLTGRAALRDTSAMATI